MKSKEMSLFSRFVVNNIETKNNVAHGCIFFNFKVVVYNVETDSMSIFNDLDFLYNVYPTTSNYKITFLDSNIIPNSLFN